MSTLKDVLKGLATTIGALVLGTSTAFFVYSVVPRGIFVKEEYVYIVVGLGVATVWIFYGLILAIIDRLDKPSR